MHLDFVPGLLEFFVNVSEACGVVAVVVSLVLGLSPYVSSFVHHQMLPSNAEVRTRLGRGLVLSLEIFIAADLLRTVLTPTVQDVASVALITIVRIALSLSLDYEMRGLTTEQPADGNPPVGSDRAGHRDTSGR